MPDLRSQLIHSLTMERMRDNSMQLFPVEGDKPRLNRWWLGAALMALHQGRFHLITNRAGTALYMLRCWLSVPRDNPQRKAVAAAPGEAFESGESQLLHWILQPDDCSALHDHPWDFETEILEGGYLEHVNTPDGVSARDINMGLTHRPGDTVRKTGESLHAIAELCAGPGQILTTGITGGAWTCVRTAPRFRRWGFHPPGAAWVDREVYLHNKAKVLA